MTFKQNEKDQLLSLKGVGPSVIQRLEEIGISSFSELRQYKTEEITERVASMLNTTCWKNSPQAKRAISAAIELAQREC